ncbi:hypothetical protein DM806_05885 [Sphingobium lactosutens]|uniref:helix-turn-helix transcriptional regulator n=1 Tax=Sphingobium lactosutens TaxID=522773 RepID=UPI0015BFB3FB|nr:hypothetical protein [Sphingobium lactosutens]NWK95201.1 hypothetical protein [Sphingobium lactosutens]
MPEDMPDLSQLNDGEREVLRLFAQGHTAKSVAALTGKSVGSINERLRDARRKTGVTSSRALSRHLADQENRDMIIGVEESPPGDADALQAAAKPRSALIRGVVMIAIIATILTGAALFMQASTPAAQDITNPAKDDPLLAETLSGPYPSQLYAMLRGETRDPAWAGGAEVALHAQYVKLLKRYGSNQPVRVLCGRTLCEVAFQADVPSGSINKLMEELQDSTLTEAMAKDRLKPSVRSFGGPGKSLVHSAYWTRADAPKN